MGKVLGGQGGTLLLTLNNKTNTIGGRVAGWAAGPTTEPALGPNDRMNTTDVPEEIEARPDKSINCLFERFNSDGINFGWVLISDEVLCIV